MTNQLSTVVKKYYASLSDWRNIPIDEFDKSTIEWLKSWNKFSAFIQIWSWSNKFNGEVSLVKEIVEVKAVSTAWLKYICDFASHHPLSETCDCNKKYNIFPIQFRMTAWDHFKKVPSQITESEKNKILALF